MRRYLTVDDSHKIEGAVVDRLKTVLTQLRPSKKETIDDAFERSRSGWEEVRVSMHAEAAHMGAAYLVVEDSENLNVSCASCFQS